MWCRQVVIVWFHHLASWSTCSPTWTRFFRHSCICRKPHPLLFLLLLFGSYVMSGSFTALLKLWVPVCVPVSAYVWLCVCPPQLFDLLNREETLLNVIKSVTRNGRSIVLTAVLALILVYLFSIVGFLFLKDDFLMDVQRLPGQYP